jgi:small subunit ribosomal protein S7
MPRRSYKKIKTTTDSVYKSHEVAKLVNYIMVDGKKSVSEKIVYSVIDRLGKEAGDGLKALRQAIQNVAPIHEVKPRRIGGASYLVPTEVRPDRKLFLGLNWIVTAAKARPNKEFRTFADKLYTEIMDAAKNQGAAVAKRQQTEKVADANKAFSHLKW